MRCSTTSGGAPCRLATPGIARGARARSSIHVSERNSATPPDRTEGRSPGSGPEPGLRSSDVIDGASSAEHHRPAKPARRRGTRRSADRDTARRRGMPLGRRRPRACRADPGAARARRGGRETPTTGVLPLGVCRSGGEPDAPQVVDAGAALELLHTFALVHDDVMDGSNLRRGQPAVHRQFMTRHDDAGWRGEARRFGEGAAILVGDFAFVYADILFADAPPTAAAGLRRAAPRAVRRTAPRPRRHGERIGRRPPSRADRALQVGQVHGRAAAAPRRGARGAAPRARGAAEPRRPAARRGLPAPRRSPRRLRGLQRHGQARRGRSARGAS